MTYKQLVYYETIKFIKETAFDALMVFLSMVLAASVSIAIFWILGFR